MPSRSFSKREPSITDPSVLDRYAKHNQSTESIRSPNHPTTNSQRQHQTIAAPQPPPNWPLSIIHLTHPVLSRYLPPSHLKWLRTKPQPPNELPIITFPISQSDTQARVAIQVIEDQRHPACGQRGLFAVRNLEPGELVVVYLGYVHGSTEVEMGVWEEGRWKREGRSRGGGDDVERLNDVARLNGTSEEDDSEKPNLTTATTLSPPSMETKDHTEKIGTWDASSYDLNMYRAGDIEIAVDAGTLGNEARFVNDYRGVPVQVQSSNRPGEAERNRKGKRRVKGWEGHDPSLLHSDRSKVEDGSEARQENVIWHNNNFDIAMPNAEFRDVWFDIPEDTHSTTNIMAVARCSTGDHLIDSISTTLEEIRLKDPQRIAGQNLQHGNQIANTGTTSRPRRKRKNGMRGVAIFVMPAGKSGKRKGGIKKDQEVLVSYGKGFWAHHGSDDQEVSVNQDGDLQRKSQGVTDGSVAREIS